MVGALAEPHRAVVSSEDSENWQIKTLSKAVKISMKQEIIEELSIGPENKQYFLPGMVGPPRVELGISTL